MRLIWIRISRRADFRGGRSPSAGPTTNSTRRDFSCSLLGRTMHQRTASVVLLPVDLFLSWDSDRWTKLLGIYFTLLRTVINLRIKSHTTKNIINNWLLLCQRGVNGVRPLLQPTLLQRGMECFQNAVQPITAFSGKKKQTLCRDNITEQRHDTPILYHPVLGSKDKNVYLRPSKTLTLQK